MTLSKKDTRQKKLQGPVKPKRKIHLTHKQNWARASNVHNKATANTDLGKKIRSMLYQMTKEQKYKESIFQKNHRAGTNYSEIEIRSSLSLAKKLASENSKKQYKRLVKIQTKKKLKKTTYKEFKKANPHLLNPLTGFDTADTESFYDS